MHIKQLIAILMIAVALSGCFDTESEKKGMEYIDDSGITVWIDGEPERVISLAPSVTEILFSLDLGERIVACDEGSNYPDETNDIEKVFSWTGLDTEKIVELQPDLIIMDRMLDLSGDSYTSLKELGLTVFRVNPESLDDIMDNILTIGEIMGVQNRAENLVDSLRSRIDAVVEKQVQGSRILHVSYYDGENDPWVLTSSTFSGDLINKAGGINTIIDSGGIAVQVSVETIVDSDPEMIFTSQSEEWPTTSRENILDDNIWSGISAVSGGMVFDVSGDLIDRPGPRMVDGLELISDYIFDFREA